MYLERAIFLSEILENPEGVQRVEDPFVLIMEDEKSLFTAPRYHKDMMYVINMLHGRSWEIINMAFYAPGLMAVLVKNPHAKRKNAGDI
jgi:hypothetical protein